MSIKYRLILIAAVPLAFLIFLSARNVTTSISNQSRAAGVARAVDDAVVLSNLVHELQKERGASAGYIGSKGASFRGELASYQRSVDGAIDALENVKKSAPPALSESLDAIERKLDQLPSIRSQVSQLSVPLPTAAGFYTSTINDLLGAVSASLNTDAGAVNSRARAYIALMAAKEYAGLERAMGANGFGAGAFPPAVYDKFVSFSAKQDAMLADVEKYASPEDAKELSQLITSQPFTAITSFREAASASMYDPNSLSAFSGGAWFSTATSRIEALKQLEDQFGETLQATARSTAQSAQTGLIISIAFGFTTVLLTMGFAYLSVRAIVKPLSGLTSEINKIPERDFSPNAEIAARRDEIGEMAKTLEEVKVELKAASEKEIDNSFKSAGINGTTVAVMMVDRDFKVTYVNEATKRLLAENADVFRKVWPNFDPNCIVGSCIDMFHKNPQHQRQLLADPSRLPYKTDIHIEDFTFALNVGAVYSEDGSYIGNVLEWENVTEKRETEKALNGVMAALELTQATVEFTMDGKVIAANENFLNVIGYSLEEIVGRHHSLFVDSKESSTPAYRAFWDKLRSGEFDAGKYKRVTKSGEDVWIQAAYTPILDEKGKPYKVIKFATDITEAETDINETRAKVSAISKSQAVIEFELDGTVIDANDLFLTVLGYSRDEIIGKHHRMFCNAAFAHSPEYQQHWERLRNGEFVEGHFERVAKNGDPVWIQASYNPLLDLDGKPYKVVKFASDVTGVELDRQRNEEERARKAAEQAGVVSALASGLQRLSDGDLTAQIEQSFAEEYDQLRIDFNAAISKLSDAMRGVVLNADGIRTSAGEISQAADDLSRRTEGQAATLEETAASLEELTASVTGAAEGADKANRVVSEAKRNAEESGEVVREAVSAMAEIEKSSEQISQIITVIDDIAFQTNLLALNAGVEAARAGDAGRGFAVVASEVRALAQRSSDAAKEIKTLISTSSQHVGRGVDLVGQTGKALHEIVDSVTNINELVSTIATSAKEQSTGIGEINVAVNQLDQVTQQNAAMVEQSTAASHSMAQEAEELARMVTAFKTDAAVSSVSGDVHKPAKTQRDSEATVAAQRERAAQFATQAATALKVNGGGDSEWEEF